MSDGQSALQVTVGDVELAAEWTEQNPETRAALAEALPVSGEATRWGDELYVSVPIEVGAEEPREEVPEGAIACWPDGNALCLFWGPTPASRGDEPRAAAPVNVVARLAETAPLSEIEGGAFVRVRRQ